MPDDVDLSSLKATVGKFVTEADGHEAALARALWPRVSRVHATSDIRSGRPLGDTTSRRKYGLRFRWRF